MQVEHVTASAKLGAAKQGCRDMRSNGFADLESAAEGQESRPPQDARKSLIPGVILLGGAVLSLLVCGFLLVYGSGRGLDLTDEIFYLIWARNPNAYQLVYQPFGHLLHPLFQLAGGDLQTYRLTGIAITAGAGVFLGNALPGASRNRAAFLVYGAAAALTIFFPWIITPSYNSAANVGALLILGGILEILRGSPRARLTGAVAGAVGLCLAAFGKPPLFAIAVVAMTLTAITAREARAALFASLVLGTVLISLILAPADIVALVGRMSASQHVLGLPNTPLALPAKLVRDGLAVPPPLIAAAIAAGFSLVLLRVRWSPWLGYVAVALSLYYFASVAAEAIAGEIPDFLGLAVVTTAAGYAGVVQRERRTDRFGFALLLTAPAAVALGTFNNQWFQLNFSMAFPFLALFDLAAADPAPWRRSAAQALAIVGPAGVLVLAAFHPYSLPASIFDQQIRVEPPLAHGAVLVDAETARFVRSAHGLANGALIVDLSGAGPGVGAVIGAREPVLPWINPATPRWADVVWSELSAEEREQAWFVVPIWPLFDHTAPAQWLMAHKPGFCRIALPSMTFWGEERALELWRPCASAARIVNKNE